MDASVPDIALEPDKTVRKVQDKFRLDLNDEEALRYMQNLIDVSAAAVMAALVEQLHKIAQYWRKWNLLLFISFTYPPPSLSISFIHPELRFLEEKTKQNESEMAFEALSLFAACHLSLIIKERKKRRRKL